MNTYTTTDALKDSYYSLAEARHDAESNGWGDGLRFDDSEHAIEIVHEGGCRFSWSCGTCGERSASEYIGETKALPSALDHIKYAPVRQAAR